MEQVILVDKNDIKLGVMEKMEAHRKGVLHRAVSVLVFNTNGDMLLQKRARNKYHSAGLWTNTACTHPSPGEDVKEAGKRRLNEEMGLMLEIDFQYSFQYRVDLDKGMIENELDHVFFGVSDAMPILNPTEVDDYLYINPLDLRKSIDEKPTNFTKWFQIIYEESFNKILMYSNLIKLRKENE